MKSHYIIKFKTGDTDKNGIENYFFKKTSRKFSSVKAVQKSLEKVFEEDWSALQAETIEDITPCSEDWGKKV